MVTIYKQYFKIEDVVEIIVPLGSYAIKVGVQQGVPTIWYMCEKNEMESGTITLRIYGTGHDVEEHPEDYLDTLFMNSGLVWHVFRGED